MTTKSILSEPDISKDAVAGRATLQDVARLAGVSPATVSRVLNDPDKVANDTTARVRNAIVATRFVPNAMAVGLANRRTRETQGQQAAPTLSASGLPPRGLAALEAAAAPSAPVVPHSARRAGLVAVLTRQGPADETVAGLVEELAQHNVTALLAHACADEASLRRAAEAAFAHHPAALVLAGLRGDPHLRRRLAKAGVVVVETGDLADDPIDMAVGFSHFAAGHAVARLLAGRGYRRPFLIVEKERGPQAWLEGARAGFASLSAMVPGHLPHRVVPAGNPHALGRETLADLLDQAPSTTDVVMCSSDALAQGVLAEAASRSLRVPDDLAVFGFGDADFAAHTHPRLSTVHVDARGIGRRAARLLLARLDGCGTAKPGHRTVDVSFSLISRDSA